MKKNVLYILLVFLLPILAVLWWWGLFSQATVTISERGGYHYAYLEAIGVYSKHGSKQNEVRFELKQQGIAPGAQVTLILTDPRTTPHDQLRAYTGYMIAADATPKPPLKTATIPMRRVVVAQIKAHPLFAYGKTYSALLKFSRQHNMLLHLPTLEINQASVLSVEMPLDAQQQPSPPKPLIK
ncbi:MAG: GyrI-like domain-containing protein [Methylophilaceae bacterium]|nr:GyrI-like domain-containing protein [Methylophilaceae bacterium]